MDDIKIAAGYVRVSTDSQEEYSPDSQIKLIRDYAKREGYVIPDEYIFRDDGISGKSADKRPAFRLMIATAKEENHPFDAIFVWKYSRFARNQEESIVYKSMLARSGVNVISISEPLAEGPFGSLIERILEWMDEFYLIRLSGEVKRGMREKASRGEATGRAPYGYSVKDKILTPNDSADVVRYIFESYKNGKGFREIAVDLNSQEIRTRKGSPFTLYDVRYILKNPVYIGKIRWSEEEHPTYRAAQYSPKDEDLRDGQHEAIIDEELWNAVQKQIDKNQPEVKYTRKNGHEYMLKGLLRCSNCGATLTRTSKGGKRLAYQCYNYSRGKCNISHYIKEEVANETVIAAIEEVIQNKAYTFSPKRTTSPKITRDWDKLIQSERSRLNRAKNALLDGALTSSEYKEIKAEIQSTLIRLEAQKEKDNPQDAKVDAASYSKKVLSVVDILKSPDISPLEKNKALRTIIDKIVYNKAENTLDLYFLE